LTAIFCLVAGTSLQAAPQAGLEDLDPPLVRLSAAALSETADCLDASLTAPPAGYHSLAVLSCPAAAESQDLSTIRPSASSVILRAPVEDRPSGLMTDNTYPQTSGLSGTATDERAIPLNNTNGLSMGPGGFGRIITGRPMAGMNNWTDAGETAISYIRPHVNVEMMLAVEFSGHRQPSDFEGPGLSPHAYLDIDHRSRVDSQDIGASTAMFGGRPTPVSVNEPQTAVAVGLDLGILPTFLSQMGLSLSVVASRGQETGDTRLALVGNSELPVDWAPNERPINHPSGLGVEELAAGGGASPFSGGGSSGSGGAPGSAVSGPTSLIPIVPVPEPATLSLLAVAAGAMLARKRHGRR
jgi:hypothetical protein